MLVLSLFPVLLKMPNHDVPFLLRKGQIVQSCWWMLFGSEQRSRSSWWRHSPSFPPSSSPGTRWPGGCRGCCLVLVLSEHLHPMHFLGKVSAGKDQMIWLLEVIYVEGVNLQLLTWWDGKLGEETNLLGPRATQQSLKGFSVLVIALFFDHLVFLVYCSICLKSSPWTVFLLGSRGMRKKMHELRKKKPRGITNNVNIAKWTRSQGVQRVRGRWTVLGSWYF